MWSILDAGVRRAAGGQGQINGDLNGNGELVFKGIDWTLELDSVGRWIYHLDDDGSPLSSIPSKEIHGVMSKDL